ncbi:MAG TPA: BTAD domain-containing putative transcriptional regulator [Rudaea sp.]|nr:BTAD domain-containing putative transcriptional regulator [Rudaea sp.]
MKRSLFSELQRRNVLRAAAFYIAAVWALAQGIAQLGPAVGAPEWTTRWFLVAAVIGFPLWIAFAWFYEFTPEGLKRESEVEPHESITRHTGRKLDFAIIGVLAVAVVLLLTDRLVLHHAANGETAAPAKSIAVLPFLNLSSDREQEYFSDGIAEDLLNLLAKVQSLQVAARTSSFALKGQKLEIPEIGRRLRVANVLEGSVRRAGDAVRITAQLIRAADGYEIWAQTWNRKFDDVFAIQDEIASDVARQLEVKLLGTAPTAHSADPKAYALVLQARQLMRQGTAPSLDQAIALSQQAIAIDSAYAEPWSIAAGAYINQANKGLKPIDESYRLARAAVDKALAIDPKLVGAHLQLSRIASDYDNDLAAAARHIEHALALEPANLDAISAAAGLEQNLGRLEQAARLDEYAVAHDPLNPKSHGSLAYDYSRLGRIDEAIASYRTALRLSPGRVGTAYNIGELLLRKGDAAAALDQMQQEADENWRLMGLTMAQHALGRKAESDASLRELIARYETDSAYNIAYVMAFRGETDRAFEWLKKAVAYHDTGLVEIGTDPMFASIHDDPRWLPFLREIGKSPEQLAQIELDVRLPEDHSASSDTGAAQTTATTR